MKHAYTTVNAPITLKRCPICHITAPAHEAFYVKLRGRDKPVNARTSSDYDHKCKQCYYQPARPLELIAPDEEFRPVVGWEGYYSVSNYGRVKREKRAMGGARINGLLTPICLPTGHGWVRLSANSRRERPLIHRIVAAAFIGPCPEGMVVNHIDFNPRNNHVSNLEYCTQGDNVRHSASAGRKRKPKNRPLVSH